MSVVEEDTNGELSSIYPDLFETETIIGSIYKISSPNTTKFYIGSTIHTTKRRFNHHKSTYKSYVSGKTKSYCSSYQIIECKECTIETIEKIPINLSDLHSVYMFRGREKYWIEYYRQISPELIVNRFVPNLDKKQYKINYHIKHRPKRLKQMREYYLKNKLLIRTQKQRLVFCIYCNRFFMKSVIYRHNNTLKHIKNFIMW
jgi:hypothetical protein